MKPVLKYPGAKWRIADWIIKYFPKHHSYLEPFFGSGAVLFSKPPSPIETINDLDWNVCNLFRIIREDAEKLASYVAMTPYSRDEYEDIYKLDIAELMGKIDPYEKARQFLVQCWQGHGFRTNGYKVGWKNDVQGREQMYAVYNWYRLPEQIIAVADRLKQVQIENKPALEVIERFKFKNVLIYTDPPYVLGTRAGKQYKHEMTDADHIDLLDALDAHPGPVILSGYACDLYDTRLQHWHRETKTAQAEKGQSRTEVLWINPVAAKNVQGRLFP